MSDKAKADSVPPKRDNSQPKEVEFGNPLEEEKALISWKAAARPYKKREREYFTTIGALVFLLSIILAFLKEFLAIFAVWALAFFSYILAKIEPEITSYSITTRGIKAGKNKYYWAELARFWFEEKWGFKILMIETWRSFPGRLMLVLGETPKEQVKKILVKKIMQDKPEKTWVDKASEWIVEKIPLEGEPRNSLPAG